LGNEQTLTTDQQSGVLRNAVTAGAALGVGVTLLLTYRRQRATEENLSITDSLWNYSNGSMILRWSPP
jgi:hypothetical protein